MAKARKKTSKKASKKATKRTTKKRAAKKTTTRKRRTPAQVAATKRLVAANKARAKGRKPATRKTGKKRTAKRKTTKRVVRRHSKAYWTKWASNQPSPVTASGHLIKSGPMTRAQHNAAMQAERVMRPKRKAPRRRKHTYTGEYYAAPRGKMYGPTRADYVGPILPKSHTRKRKGTPGNTRRGAKVRTVTAAQIIGNATKASKFHKMAAWICVNKNGRRTGCGGGKHGGHVAGILR